ncbi:MAG: hypothetical protein Q7S95_03540 [bacterium]|nr:hypothetical protein [bacterium]
MTFADFIGSGSTGIFGILNNVAIPLIFALAFGVFIWGIVKYFFLHANDDTERARGKQFALWGIVGLALLFSIWGLVNLLLSTLGITAGR